MMRLIAVKLRYFSLCCGTDAICPQMKWCMRHCYFALGESFFTLVVFEFPVCWPYLGRVSGPGMLIDWLTMHSSRISIRE